MFASTMRSLFSDIATTKILDNLVPSNKPAPKIQRAQPFCKRQQNLALRDAVGSNTVTAQSTNAAATFSYQNQNQNREPSGRKALSYAQISVGQAHQHLMGSNYSGKGIQNPIHEPNLNHGPTADKHLQKSNKKLSTEASRVLTEEMASFMLKRVIEEIQSREPGLYS
ncbi:hypothetical protein BB561_000608 [Smittium simulii]|uniref:Uncharacterized protein n=1 Tax=Smittium simulii TaxID=133385 RepID=A0A2T9YYJ7_9FUNG|nr:hypothetical protein BB561_000608 [Smittium simulii]